MKKFLPAFTICILFALQAVAFTKVVTVSNHVFTPASFTINLGDTIKWTWVSGSHTTTSLGIPAGAASWNKSINSTNTTFIYVPSKTGLYNYKCTPHQAMGMIGNFTVNAGCAPASAQITAASGTTFCKGGSVLLNSNTSANITSYQWKKNGTNIAGATASSYTADLNGSYTLTVINNCGNTATSNAINVTVKALPKAIITPSGNVDICSGSSIKLQATTAAGQTYQWQKNGVDIAGATASSYTTKKAGRYTVTVTKTSTGCSKKSAVTKVTIIQCIASGQQENAIKIFPNPSSGNFHITLPSFVNNQYTLSIFDGNGNAIGTSKINSEYYSFGNELKPGIYLIQVKNNSKIVLEEKIIKE